VYRKTDKYKEYLEAKKVHKKMRKVKGDQSNPRKTIKKSSSVKTSKLAKKKTSKGRGNVKSLVVKKAGSKTSNSKKLTGKMRKTRSKSK